MSFLEALRRGFSRTFWIANVLELFERLAYYAAKAILAVYIAEYVYDTASRRPLGPEAAGFLAGSVFNTLLYLLPPLAGTVADPPQGPARIDCPGRVATAYRSRAPPITPV